MADRDAMDVVVCGMSALAAYQGQTVKYSEYSKQKKAGQSVTIKKVIFNEPATIVFWSDNTKTVVKCAEDEVYDPEKGLAMAIAKRALGNEGNYYNTFRKWLPKEQVYLKETHVVRVPVANVDDIANAISYLRLSDYNV